MLFDNLDNNRVNRFIICVALLWISASIQILVAAPKIYADGDLAPLGMPDNLINSADYLIANRIELDLITPTELERSHGDI